MFRISESQIEQLFLLECGKLGFSQLQKIDGNPNLSPRKHHLGPGDYLAVRNGKQVRIEIEYALSSFFIHQKCVRDIIDVVVVIQDNTIRDEKKAKELKNKDIIVLEEPEKIPSREELAKEKRMVEKAFGTFEEPKKILRQEKHMTEKEMVERAFGKGDLAGTKT